MGSLLSQPKKTQWIIAGLTAFTLVSTYLIYKRLATGLIPIINDIDIKRKLLTVNVVSDKGACECEQPSQFVPYGYPEAAISEEIY